MTMPWVSRHCSFWNLAEHDELTDVSIIDTIVLSRCIEVFAVYLKAEVSSVLVGVAGQPDQATP